MSLNPASLYSLALIGATILTAGLASWFMYHRARGSSAFTLLMLALSWWSCAYAQELSSSDLAMAVLWGKLQYLAIVAVPALWLTFGLRYSGHSATPSRLGRLALAVIPLITLALVWTTEAHGLVWSNMALIQVGGFQLLNVDHGPWFWVHTVYSYMLVIVGTTIMLGATWRAAPTYRRQSIYLAISALLPLVGNVIYLTGRTPVPGLDLTPLLFTVSGLLIARASYRSYFATIGPVARNQLIEEMADIVLVLDGHGQIADVNQAGIDFLGVSNAFRRQLTTVAPLLAPHLLADDAPPELTVGKGEAGRTYDVQRVPLRGWVGVQGGVLVVLRDITLRKRAEQRLRDQKELFAALAMLNHAKAARPALPEALRSILRVAAELTGASQGSIFLLAGDSPDMQSALFYGVTGAVSAPQVIRQVRESGLAGWVMHHRQVALVNDTATDPRWITFPEQSYVIGSALAVPVMEGGDVLGVITLSHHDADYFQEEHAELMSAAAAQIGLAVRNAQMYDIQRQLVERAEAANRAKSTFLATTSHELRTPLNIIIGYSEILCEDLQGHDSGATVMHLRQINEAGRQLLAMVNDILDLARVEAGQATLELEPIDLGAFVFQLMILARPLAAQNFNTLELDYPEGAGVIVSDLGKLRTILLQILSNACKFTDHGHVTLAVRRDAGGGAVFQVTDTGIGIAEEQLPLLFSDFTQGDGSSTRRYGGVGLGLALSQHLCQHLGGEIRVQSHMGQGSTFTLRLPANAPDGDANLCTS